MSDLRGVQDGMALPHQPPVRAHRRRGWLRRLTVLLLVLAGLAGAAGGGIGLLRELTRHATHAEAAAAMRGEIASRWRRLPAEQIFRPSVAYSTWEGLTSAARRVGIAPAASCSSALDPAIARSFASRGCISVLRATYLDPSGTVAATAGIAVMPDTGAATKAMSVLAARGHHTGVKAVPFPGTVAHLFGNRQRSWFDATAAGPYVFLTTGGYTSDRSGKRAARNPAFTDLSSGLTQMEITALTAAGDPCGHKDIQC